MNVSQVYSSQWFSSYLNIRNVSFHAQLDIAGHSGDAPVLMFYNGNSPPSNDKERLDILKVCFTSKTCTV